MKTLKILGLIMVSFILVNCDNSKPAANNSATEDYSKSQDLVIEEVKKQLPIEVDELTTLIDVSKSNNMINYKYDVKGTAKETLLVPEGQKIIRDTLLEVYCGDSQEIKALKSVFPNGANYAYVVKNEQVLAIPITPADCKAK